MSVVLEMQTCFMLRLSTTKVAIADLMPVTKDDYTYTDFKRLMSSEKRYCTINRINVPEGFRGQGFGSQLLRQVCEAADTNGVTLIAVVSSSGEMSNKDLKQWYERYGFVADEDNKYYMQRDPKV